MIIILDNGHGARQEGKRSAPFTYNGETVIFEEWRFNLAVATMAAEILENHGLSVFVTMPDAEKHGAALELRVKRANDIKDKDKIFVSIHANAAPTTPESPWHPAKGAEVYYPAMVPVDDPSRMAAAIVLNEIVSYTGLLYRGIKPGNYYVLRKVNAPVKILTETGFFTNLVEVQKLLNPDFQRKVAEAHAAGIMKYLAAYA